MESYLNSTSKKSLDSIICYLKNTKEYKMVNEYKKEIYNNKKLMYLIEEIKTIQKEYVKSNYSDNLKYKLDYKLEKLNSDSIYQTYSYYLEKVNGMISLVKNELNDYFENIVNSIRLED